MEVDLVQGVEASAVCDALVLGVEVVAFIPLGEERCSWLGEEVAGNVIGLLELAGWGLLTAVGWTGQVAGDR